MHDKNGKLIQVGDTVQLVGKVVATPAGTNGTFCSVSVKLEGDWDGKGGKGLQWFSAKQLEVIDTAPLATD